MTDTTISVIYLHPATRLAAAIVTSGALMYIAAWFAAAPMPTP
jgi:hypothetical protein